jgi:hypothetical protein
MDNEIQRAPHLPPQPREDENELQVKAAGMANAQEPEDQSTESSSKPRSRFRIIAIMSALFVRLSFLMNAVCSSLS